MHCLVTRLLTCLLLAFFLAGPAMAEPEPIFDIPDEREKELAERDKDKKLFDEDGGPADVGPHQTTGEVPFWDQHHKEVNTLAYLLTSEAWHYRVFGLLRLERFKGPEVGQCLVRAMQDPDWQVRCFAIRSAVRKDVDIPEGIFELEKEPRVIRMAQRVGVPLPEAVVRRIAERELASRIPERIVLGIEIASRCGDKALETKAKKRMGQLLQNMNTAVLVTVGDRLAELLGVDPSPTSLRTWQSLIERQGKTLTFPEFKPRTEEIRAEDFAPLAEKNTREFMQTVDYFDQLHEQSFQLMVGIDGTGSMGGVITQAQSQTNRLMVIFNDLAKSMEMGFIIFRTTGDKPVLEGTPLTHNLGKLRSFLFKVEAKGGGSEPEAIYETLGAMKKGGWSSQAIKQIIIVADEAVQPQTIASIHKRAKAYKNGGTPVHTVAAGPAAKETLEAIAEVGGGTCVELSDSDELGKLIIGLLIEEDLRPSFDHLYDLYIDLGM